MVWIELRTSGNALVRACTVHSIARSAIAFYSQEGQVPRHLPSFGLKV